MSGEGSLCAGTVGTVPALFYGGTYESVEISPGLRSGGKYVYAADRLHTGRQSSEQQEAPAPALSMAEAPQSTASPMEQTGYGYRGEDADPVRNGDFCTAVLMGEKLGWWSRRRTAA